ncbi:polyprenyl synthetase family protein [Lentisphaerota bacterium WC36G]|nr:polyprenyl synthetase family protein [Lentisphaerae bacterium WC36]
MRESLNKIADKVTEYLTKSNFYDNIELDFLKDAIKDYPLRGGKRLRPALLIWSARLFDENIAIEKLLPAAAAIEIYHNWTLVHDDIIDNDEVRRNQKSCHALLNEYAQKNRPLHRERSERFGLEFAILAGDVQQAWAMNEILNLASQQNVDAKLTIAIAQRLNEIVNCKLISGEAFDIDFSYCNWLEISTEQINHMIYLKTAVLLQFAAETGVAIALNCADFKNNESINKISEFVYCAGLAFQYRDDWLGIFGDFEKFGKPICSDLSENKPTILLSYALKNSSETDHHRLLELSGQARYTHDEITEIQNIVRDSGAEQYLIDLMTNLKTDALNILKECPNNKYRNYLHKCLNYFIERDV